MKGAEAGEHDWRVRIELTVTGGDPVHAVGPPPQAATVTYAVAQTPVQYTGHLQLYQYDPMVTGWRWETMDTVEGTYIAP